MINHLLFGVAVLSLPYHFEPMRKFIAIMIGLPLFEACSPPDEHSPSPEVTPAQNQKGVQESNASATPEADSNKTQAAEGQPASELASFLKGKQLKLVVSNNAVKLAPKFANNGTWVNTMDPTQKGSYTVKEDGRVILSLPDKNRMILSFDGNSVKAKDEVVIEMGDTLIFSEVKSVK